MKKVNDQNNQIKDLESQLKVEQEKFKSLESTMSSSDRENYNKLLTMNKSMVNLKQMYKQLLKAKNAEQEVKVLNKKCKRKEASIK